MQYTGIVLKKFDICIYETISDLKLRFFSLSGNITCGSSKQHATAYLLRRRASANGNGNARFVKIERLGGLNIIIRTTCFYGKEIGMRESFNFENV